MRDQTSFITLTTAIPSPNEVATNAGIVVPATKTERFIHVVNRANVVPPLSGREMMFDGSGHCVSGCAATKRRAY